MYDAASDQVAFARGALGNILQNVKDAVGEAPKSVEVKGAKVKPVSEAAGDVRSMAATGVKSKAAIAASVMQAEAWGFKAQPAEDVLAAAKRRAGVPTQGSV